jgi:hypothetical protein
MMTSPRFSLLAAGALIATAATLLPSSARAENAATPAVKHAQARFREGMRLFQRGEIGSACRAFEESYDEDPAPGTLYNLGACHEKEGQIARAYREWDELAARALEAKLKDNAALVRARADALVPRLAQVTLVHRADARSDVTSVRLDGDALLASVWRKPFYVDPGQHGFVFVHADGTSLTRTTSSLRAGDKQSLEMEDPPATPAVAAIPPTPAATPSPPSAPAVGVDTPASSSTSGTRIAGVVVGGAGVALLAVGAVFGLRAIGKRNDASDLCPGGQCTAPNTPADAYALRHDAKVAGTFSTVGFIAGGAALGTAVLLFVAGAPKTESAAPTTSLVPSVGPGGASFTLQRTF